MTVHGLLSNYFLSPYGLLAGLSIIPLILFYLMRPEPEDEIMPSIAFFMKDKNSGRMQQALNRIIRNLMLLFHVLLLLGFAVAMAEPYMETGSTPDHSIVILDRSASMETGLESAKSFAQNSLGKENTLILAGNEVGVPVEKASAGKTRREISGIQTRDIKTDIAGALELASDYQGPVFVASDLDQTVNQKNPGEIIEQLRDNGRLVKVMDRKGTNSWGIVGISPGESNSSVEVKNFREENVSISITTNGNPGEVRIDPGEVEPVTFSTEPGRNIVKLEEDEMSSDNTAYISVPQDREYDVVFIRDSPNPYFEKAVELIPFTRLETLAPPAQGTVEGDIYVVGDTSRILQSTVDSIESEVRKGDSLVVFSQPGLGNAGFSSLPVEPGNGFSNTSVEIRKPVRTSVDTRILDVKKKKGEAYATPETAIIKASYGGGEVLFYNIEDSDFNKEFLYPVFWKRIFNELSDRPDIEQLNLQTGTTVNESSVIEPGGETLSGQVELKQAGFYNSSSGTYAANLVSEDESGIERSEIPSQDSSEGSTRKNLQNLMVVLLAVLATMELLYLIYAGEL